MGGRHYSELAEGRLRIALGLLIGVALLQGTRERRSRLRLSRHRLRSQLGEPRLALKAEADLANVVQAPNGVVDLPDKAGKVIDCDMVVMGVGLMPDSILGKAAGKRKTESSKATFRFTSDDAGATFQCRLDKEPFSDCNSPTKYKKLKVRKHRFRVQATDSKGNVGEIVSFGWRVVD